MWSLGCEHVLAAALPGSQEMAEIFEHRAVLMHAAAVLTAAYFLFFFPLASFRYRVTGGRIELEWIVFGFLRVSRRTIGLAEVEDARVTSFVRCVTSGSGFHVFGNVFARRGVALLLRKGVLWFSFGRIVYISPRDPDAFVAEVREAIQALSASA